MNSNNQEADIEFSKIKEKGNSCFRDKQYKDAISYYSKAIDIKPNDPIAFSNRAQCHLNLNSYYEAEDDCTSAIKLDSKFNKAYYRRATARKHLMRYHEAINDYRQLISLDPTFTKAKEELKALEELSISNQRIPVPDCLFDKPERFKSKTPSKNISITLI